MAKLFVDITLGNKTSVIDSSLINAVKVACENAGMEVNEKELTANLYVAASYKSEEALCKVFKSSSSCKLVTTNCWLEFERNDNEQYKQDISLLKEAVGDVRGIGVTVAVGKTKNMAVSSKANLDELISKFDNCDFWRENSKFSNSGNPTGVKAWKGQGGLTVSIWKKAGAWKVSFSNCAPDTETAKFGRILIG